MNSGTMMTQQRAMASCQRQGCAMRVKGAAGMMKNLSSKSSGFSSKNVGALQEGNARWCCSAKRATVSAGQAPRAEISYIMIKPDGA